MFISLEAGILFDVFAVLMIDNLGEAEVFLRLKFSFAGLIAFISPVHSVLRGLWKVFRTNIASRILIYKGKASMCQSISDNCKKFSIL